MPFVIGIALAASTGNIVYGILSGLAWLFLADSIVGIIIALAVIGGLGMVFGISA